MSSTRSAPPALDALPGRAAIGRFLTIALLCMPSGAVLLGVYHCGARVRNGIRPLAMQRTDCVRIGRLLEVYA